MAAIVAVVVLVLVLVFVLVLAVDADTRTCVCSRVLTTSRGKMEAHVTTPAKPPQRRIFTSSRRWKLSCPFAAGDEEDEEVEVEEGRSRALLHS